ncbi:MAG: enoyl-CoA hydratase/isomerase family protein, partial [Comamonadaceae bacterium]
MTSSTGSTPHYQAEGGIATITLRRPAHRNRLHNDDLATLMALFERIDADRAIRVVVLTAQVLPERPVFSAGYNAEEFAGDAPPVSFATVVDALERLRPVTLCALNGSVHGGATDFALACDLAIGVEGMEMRMPAAALGLHYYPSGLARYVSRLGVNVAKQAFLTAQALDGPTLLRVGYLQQLVPAAEFPAQVQRLAATVAALAPRDLGQRQLERLQRQRRERCHRGRQPLHLRREFRRGDELLQVAHAQQRR